MIKSKNFPETYSENLIVSIHENTKRLTKEIARYLSANQVEVKVIMTEKEYLEVERVQDLECQKQKKPVSMKNTIVQVAKTYLEKNDRVIRAVRAQVRELKKKSAGTCRINLANNA